MYEFFHKQIPTKGHYGGLAKTFFQGSPKYLKISLTCIGFNILCKGL